MIGLLRHRTNLTLQISVRVLSLPCNERTALIHDPTIPPHTCIDYLTSNDLLDLLCLRHFR